jgi:hypothetical protein
MTYQVNDKLYFVSDMQKGDVVVSGIVVDVGVPENNKIDYIMQFPEDADPDTSNQLYALTEAEYLEYYKRQPEVAATNKKDDNMNNQAFIEKIKELETKLNDYENNVDPKYTDLINCNIYVVREDNKFVIYKVTNTKPSEYHVRYFEQLLITAIYRQAAEGSITINATILNNLVARAVQKEILFQDNPVDTAEQTVDNTPMMVTATPVSPSSNMEYRSRLRKLRSGYRKELKDLKNEYGVAPRHRANFTKVKKG